jgi:hypothetical protein
VLGEVRKKGLIQATWASALFVLFLAIGYWLRSIGLHHTPWEFAIPGGWALAGLLQAVTGVPFAKFASRWDALQPWQRGVFGTAIVFGLAALLYGLAIAYILYGGST